MNLLHDLKAVFSNQLVKAFALVGLLCAGPFVGVHDPSEILDYDLWWHLKVGDWILTNHSFPRVGLFSQFGADRTWAAYSWGFEVLVSWFHSRFGLTGIFIFRFCAEVLITFAIFALLYRMSERFWTSVFLTGLGIWAIYHNMAFRPVLATIFFWTVVLGLILDSQKRQSIRQLYLLPVIFLIWSNFHIQFVYGLFLVALFTAVEIGKALNSRFGWIRTKDDPPNMSLLLVVGIAIGCVVATLIGPYGIGLYKVILGYAESKSMYSQITELMALNFRTTAHYVQLLLTMCGFFALGRKCKDPFRVLLLLATALIAYRTTRDSWFVCIPSMAMIAAAFNPSEVQTRLNVGRVWIRAVGVALGVVIVVFALMRNAGLNDATLKVTLGNFFPMRSADFIRASRIAGPLYNNLNFGGFLIWYLPDYPVAIDGRNDLYPQDYSDRYYAVLTGASDPMRDPDLTKAKVVVLQRGYALTNYMYQDPRFRLVFEDSNAVVFARD